MRAGERKLNGIVHFCARVVVQLADFFLVEDALAQQVGAEARNGVLLFCCPVFLFVSVDANGLMFGKLRWRGGHSDGVAVGAEAVELRFDKAGALSGTGSFRSLGYYLVNKNRIGAIYGRAGNAERRRLLGKWIAGLRIGIFEADMGISLVFVVLEDEYDGQFPHRCHVEGFEECALLAGSVSEEAVDDLSRILDLSR